MIAGSCRSIPLRRTRSSFNVTASDSTEGWSCVQHPPRRIQTRLLIAHGACSGVADGIFAMRFLPMSHASLHNYPTTDRTPKHSRLFRVGIHRAERASPGPPVGPVPGPAPDCELCWTSPWFRTSAIARLWKISLPELQGGSTAHRRVTVLCPELTRGQAVGLGSRLSAKPTMSHDTPRKMMLMPTSTPMIVSPDIGSSRQIITPRTTSIAPLSNSQPQPSNR